MLIAAWQDAVRSFVLRPLFVGNGQPGLIRRRRTSLRKSRNKPIPIERLQDRCLLSAVAIFDDGSVLISDDTGSTNDALTLSVRQGNLRVNDPSHSVSATSGVTQVDTHTVELPLSSLTGSLFLSLAGGNDAVTIADDLLIPGDLIEDAEALTIRADVAAGGFLTFSGQVAIGEPLAANSSVADPVALSGTEIRFLSTLNAVIGETPVASVTASSLAEFDAVISNRQSFSSLRVEAPVLDFFVAPNATAVLSRLDAETSGFFGQNGEFGTTTIVNPSESLRFDLGFGNQQFVLNGLGVDFDADLTIDGGAGDIVQLGAGSDVGLGSGDFSVTAESVTVAGRLSTVQNGSVTVFANRWIEFLPESELHSDTGALNLTGGFDGAFNPGNKPGVTVDGATISSRAGEITLSGRGSGNVAVREGVRISNGARLISTGTGEDIGAISVTGISGTGAAGNLTGLSIDGPDTRIESVDGSISLLGSGSASSTQSTVLGVSIRDGATVESLGTSATAAPIVINGISDGTATGNFSAGVELVSGGRVLSNAGTVLISGIGGEGAGDVSPGVTLRGDAGIRTINGDILVTGVGRAAGRFSAGVLLDDLGTSNGGFIETASGTIQILGYGSTVANAQAIGTEIGILLATGDNRIAATADGSVTLTAIGGSFSAGILLGFPDFDGLNQIGSASSSGEITLVTDSLLIGKTPQFQSTGRLNLFPVTPGTTIGIGSGAGELQFDDLFLAGLVPGFELIQFGDASSHPGIVDIQDAVFTSPVSITGEAITASGLDAGPFDVSLNAISGRILGGNGDVDVRGSSVQLATLTTSLINGSIGTISNPLRIEANALTTNSAASFSGQFLQAVGDVGINSLDAGPVMITLFGDRFSLNRPEAIADDTVLELAESGVSLSLNGFDETIGGLSGIGSVDPAAATLTVDADDLFVFDGRVTGDGEFTKTGSGTLILSGVSSFNGRISAAEGRLQATASGSLGAGGSEASGTSILAGAELTFPQSIVLSEQLLVSGTLNLKAGPQPVSVVTGSASFSPGSILAMRLNASSDGGFDRLRVNGTLTLDDAVLSLDLNQYAPGMTDGVVLIENDGTDPIVGRFQGLPHGTVLTINGVERAVSYFAGDGNDFGLLPLARNVSVERDDSGNLTISDIADDGSRNTLLVTYDEVADEIVVTSGSPELVSGHLVSLSEVRFARADVTGSLLVDLGAGNDWLISDVLALNVVLSGGDGNDTLMTTTGDDQIDGGAGDDVIDGRAGRDAIFGGAGNDILSGGGGRDLLDGGDGDDRISGGTSGDWVYGGSGGDVLLGDDGDDFIDAGLGANFVDGGSGNDVVYGGAGSDFLNGNSGDDLLFGSGGNDTLIGAAGRDGIDGGDGNDWLRGQGGIDTLSGGRGVDLLDGGAGRTALSDVLDGSAELLDTGYRTAAGDVATSSGWLGVTLSGGDGNDVLSARQFTQGPVVLLGGDGADVLLGSSGDDVLRGGAGRDVLFGGGGRDQLFGDDGNDVLRGQGGIDTLSGGTGDDVIDGGSSVSIYREQLDGDLILSNPDGTPVLTGLGNNSFAGKFTGAILEGGDSGNRIDASAFNGNVTLLGGAGNDSITGTNRADVINAGAGDDVVNGLAGNDALNGGLGNDLLSGGVDNDTLLGGSGNDTLLGQQHNDLLLGEAGDDVINGGSGADTVAGAGNGTAAGSDRITIGNRGVIDEAIRFAFEALLSGI